MVNCIGELNSNFKKHKVMAELVQNNYHFFIKNKVVNIRLRRNPSVANALVLIPALAGQPFYSLD